MGINRWVVICDSSVSPTSVYLPTYMFMYIWLYSVIKKIHALWNWKCESPSSQCVFCKYFYIFYTLDTLFFVTTCYVSQFVLDQYLYLTDVCVVDGSSLYDRVNMNKRMAVESKSGMWITFIILSYSRWRIFKFLNKSECFYSKRDLSWTFTEHKWPLVARERPRGSIFIHRDPSSEH